MLHAYSQVPRPVLEVCEDRGAPQPLGGGRLHLHGLQYHVLLSSPAPQPVDKASRPPRPVPLCRLAAAARMSAEQLSEAGSRRALEVLHVPACAGPTLGIPRSPASSSSSPVKAASGSPLKAAQRSPFEAAAYASTASAGPAPRWPPSMAPPPGDAFNEVFCGELEAPRRLPSILKESSGTLGTLGPVPSGADSIHRNVSWTDLETGQSLEEVRVPRAVGWV